MRPKMEAGFDPWAPASAVFPSAHTPTPREPGTLILQWPRPLHDHRLHRVGIPGAREFGWVVFSPGKLTMQLARKFTGGCRGCSRRVLSAPAEQVAVACA